MLLCSPLSIASISINDLVLTVGINIIMLLRPIHDKDFFFLMIRHGGIYFQTEFSGCSRYIFQKNKQNFCGVIDLIDDP